MPWSSPEALTWQIKGHGNETPDNSNHWGEALRFHNHLTEPHTHVYIVTCMKWNRYIPLCTISLVKEWEYCYRITETTLVQCSLSLTARDTSFLHMLSFLNLCFLLGFSVLNWKLESRCLIYQGHRWQFYLGERKRCNCESLNSCISDGECFAARTKLAYLNLGCGCCVWIRMCRADSMHEADI